MELEAHLLLMKTKLEGAVALYVNAYKAKYPDERNADTGTEFLTEQYPEYRKQCAGEATLLIHNLMQERKIQEKTIEQILEANSWNIGMLFPAIVNAST